MANYYSIVNNSICVLMALCNFKEYKTKIEKEVIFFVLINKIICIVYLLVSSVLNIDNAKHNHLAFLTTFFVSTFLAWICTHRKYGKI